MISCYLTKEQLEEALAALNVAHSNGWVASKAIFTLKEYSISNYKYEWEIDKASISGEVCLITDSGLEGGHGNFGRQFTMYRDETPEDVIERNKRDWGDLP